MLPNEFVPLHIFEERYRQMLTDIEKGSGTFGLVYFDADDPFSDTPPSGSIGCSAQLRSSETLSDGRSNILTRGVQRFRIIEYVDAEAPYLVAGVEFFNDDPPVDAEVNVLADEVFALFRKLASSAYRIEGRSGRVPDIDQAPPEELSFLVTSALNFEDQKKNEFLCMTDTKERLSQLRAILTDAVSKLEATADIRAISRTNGHSKTKIDL